MGIDAEHPPQVSVVMPTYNRCELLRSQLAQLTRQTLPATEFEVVVADDGSSDGTRAVVASFEDELRLKYCFQEDLGNRVGTARNAGAAAAAAPVLVFLDTGPLFGTDFVAQHLALHRDPAHRRAIVGYAHGYNPEKTMTWVNDEVARLGPEGTVARYADDPEFRDVRYGLFEEIGFDLSRRLAPWQLFFSLNISMRAEDFHAVGGFDEAFNGAWGAEDLELGFKLFRSGVEFRLSFDAWVIDVPHERDLFDLREQLYRQFLVLLDLHREPLFEIGCALTAHHLLWSWEADYGALLAWEREAAGRSVAAEIADALGDLPPGTSIAVFGAGGELPPGAPPMTVLDFDRALVDRAAAGSVHTGHHALGLRTPLADASVDVVVVTSRLAGLWDRWSRDLLAEARRVGRDVRVFPGAVERGGRP
ncbi:glycosyltransferase [Amycolatopsis sp. A133]|uniref:glycosyltransferase n=1 Tax=Amycolatopsis sp. A133 TaxID=3064472 RepID=UPI0027F7D013|nr:glycosyltransferase [Amycolatopsis sp. A133]MDQ7810298.1 glycosyltransferase [Amycolatopsis sp. A133]